MVINKVDPKLLLELFKQAPGFGKANMLKLMKTSLDPKSASLLDQGLQSGYDPGLLAENIINDVNTARWGDTTPFKHKFIQSVRHQAYNIGTELDDMLNYKQRFPTDEEFTKYYLNDNGASRVFEGPQSVEDLLAAYPDPSKAPTRAAQSAAVFANAGTGAPVNDSTLEDLLKQRIGNGEYSPEDIAGMDDSDLDLDTIELLKKYGLR